MGRFRRGSKTAWQIAECHFEVQFILRLDAISKAEIGNRRQPCRLIHYPRVTACGWLAGVSTAAQGLMAFCAAKRHPHEWITSSVMLFLSGYLATRKGWATVSRQSCCSWRNLSFSQLFVCCMGNLFLVFVAFLRLFCLLIWTRYFACASSGH